MQEFKFEIDGKARSLHHLRHKYAILEGYTVWISWTVKFDVQIEFVTVSMYALLVSEENRMISLENTPVDQEP